MPYKWKDRQKEYVKEWFAAHPGYHAKKKRGYKKRNKEHLIHYANHHGCDECGEDTDYLYFTNGEIANSHIRARGRMAVSIETLNKELDNRHLLCEPCLKSVKGLYPSGRELGF